MYTIFTTNLINTNCPTNMTESKCPLREYIKNGQDLFHVSVNETHLVQNEYNAEKFMQVYEEMHRICNKCHADNQNTRQ